MNDITHYVLSDIAEADISDIYDYTVSKHGAAQAAVYLSGLDRFLDNLVDQPTMGKARNDIRDGLRSFQYEHHTIFYRLLDDHIRIVRILHSSRDMPRHFRV